MGYSCSAVAGIVLDKLITQLQIDSQTEHLSSNTWDVNTVTFFEERGRENSDGAITGSIHKFVAGTHSLRVAYYRIDRDGKIVRFHSSNARQREYAEVAGKMEFEKRFTPQYVDYIQGKM